MFDEVALDALPVQAEAWSAYLPDGLLGDMLSVAAGGSGWERVERIGAWERLIAWAQAAQLREVAEFASAARTDPEFGDHPDQVEASVNAEVGLMCRIAPRVAAGRVADAIALRERLPHVARALSQGRISLSAARAIAEETATLAVEQLGEVQARVLARAGSQTPGQVRAATRRAVAVADAEAVRRRAEHARRQRHVRLIPEPDGMASVTAYLPAPEAVAIYGVLDECARRTGGADEPRGMDARRADALADLVLDRAALDSLLDRTAPGGGTRAEDTCPEDASQACGSQACGSRAGRDRVRTEVRVTVGLTTLLGLEQLPGELAGYGPIPADVARELAAHGTWRRLIADPLTGNLLDYGTTRYRPPAHLAEHIIARDQTCDFPSCRVPAHRCDLDHRVPYDAETGTGPTSVDNLGARCRSHHNLKASPGWHLSGEPDGTVTWRTPTRHAYRVEREPLVHEPAASAGATISSTDPPPF